MRIYFIAPTNILSKRWLSLFRKQFSNTFAKQKLITRMRYAILLQHRESSDSVSFCEGEPTNSHIVRCVCKFSGKQTSMNLINKFHCRMAQTNLQQNACVFFLFNKTYLSLCNWQRNVLHVNEPLQIEIRNISACSIQ